MSESQEKKKGIFSGMKDGFKNIMSKADDLKSEMEMELIFSSIQKFIPKLRGFMPTIKDNLSKVNSLIFVGSITKLGDMKIVFLNKTKLTDFNIDEEAYIGMISLNEIEKLLNDANEGDSSKKIQDYIDSKKKLIEEIKNISTEEANIVSF